MKKPIHLELSDLPSAFKQNYYLSLEDIRALVARVFGVELTAPDTDPVQSERSAK